MWRHENLDGTLLAGISLIDHPGIWRITLLGVATLQQRLRLSIVKLVSPTGCLLPNYNSIALSSRVLSQQWRTSPGTSPAWQPRVHPNQQRRWQNKLISGMYCGTATNPYLCRYILCISKRVGTAGYSDSIPETSSQLQVETFTSTSNNIIRTTKWVPSLKVHLDLISNHISVSSAV